MLEEKRDIPCPECEGKLILDRNQKTISRPRCTLCGGTGTVSLRTMLAYNSQELDKLVREYFGRKP